MSLSVALLLALCLLAQPAAAVDFRSTWADASRRWFGPDWWANPLQDWSLQSGRAVVRAARNRTLALTTHSIVSVPQASSVIFEASVVITHVPRLPAAADSASSPEAGFRFGRSGPNPHRLSGLMDANRWIDAVISTSGDLFVARLGRKRRQTRAFPLRRNTPITLTLLVRRVPGNRGAAEVSLTATEGFGAGATIVTLSRMMRMRAVLGGFSLVASSPAETRGRARATFYFHRFSLSGRGVAYDAAHRIGPIVSTQYLMSDNTVKIAAQFMPVDDDQVTRKRTLATLYTKEDDAPRFRYRKRATARLHRLSRTVVFSVPNWDKSVAHDYVVETFWQGSRYVRRGKIRAEPTGTQFKIGVFSCDFGYLFPHVELTEKVRRHNPDMLFFAGDQIYETNDEFGNAKFSETDDAMLDYLRRYYRFLLSWQRLLKDRPSVIIPDDHDVFHGDLFGHGGRRLELDVVGGRRVINDRNGGYLMPGKWVRAVERTQVGVLPTAATPGVRLPIGIRTYFTTVRYARLSFAVMEDRKFKTGPDSVEMTRGRVRDLGIGADLLGPAQEQWLRNWGEDWRGHDMKIALSQTILCKATTHSGHQLARSTYIFDSGAWPIAARNRAVGILADAQALSLHGDQHLGGIVRLRADEESDWDKSYYGFMVPGTANGWPRAWWPRPTAEGPWTGTFKDDAGHDIDVVAMANPDRGSNLLARRFGDSIAAGELAYRKGSGYGMVTVDRRRKTATMGLYRVGRSADEVFDGFPKTIWIGGRQDAGARRAARFARGGGGGPNGTGTDAAAAE